MEKKKTFYGKIISLFRPFWKYFIYTIIILFILLGMGAFTPYLFGKGVDAITTGDVRLTFIFLGVSFLIAIIQQQFLYYVKEYIDVKKLDVNVTQAFSVLSLKRMLNFSIGQHINEHSGVKQTVVNKGQNALINLVDNFMYNILQSVLQIIVTLIILAVFDWRVAGVALAFVLLHILISNRRNKYYFPKLDEVRKKNQAQSKLQSELFRNATLVIAEAQENKAVEDFDSSYTKVTNFTINLWLKYIRAFYSQRVVVTVGRYATLGLGVYFIFAGYHSAGMFVTFFAWTSTIFDNVNQLMNSQRQVMNYIIEIRKFFSVLDITPDINPNIGGKTIADLKGEIQFKDVSFAYPYRQSAEQIENEEESEGNELEHTVENVSFTIPAGAKVGFVGVSGSGKSTIVNLMRRYYDTTSGEILIDGEPLKELDLHWLRSQIGNVEQKIDLFDRSIRDNILFGLPTHTEISDKKLQKAVKDASLTDFITKLKDHGLDTVIGEGGIKVSGGERQRIGIARALIKDPKILIFDEATSALDSINEKLIHDAINRSAAGRTTIIIAHRLSTVMDADIIFVVAEGKIVGQGTHTELEKKNKEYQKLIKNQILMA